MPEDETVVVRLSTGTLQTLQRLASVADPLVKFGRNPVGFITTVVAAWVVSGFLELGSVLVATGDFIGQSLAAVPALVENSLRVFAPVETQLIALSEWVALSVGRVLATAGPAAPVLVFAFAALVALSLYRLTIALIGELPAGSSLVDILGLR